MSSSRLFGAGLAAAALLDPATALAIDIPAYGGDWPVLHYDNRNSNCAPVPIADAYSRAFVNNFAQINYNRPVIDANGDVFFTYTPLEFEGGQVTPLIPSFSGFDGSTGDELFTVTAPTVDGGIISGNALISSDGSFFVSDDTAITRLTPDGTKVWSVPIRGAVASSLQFTPSGHVLAFTWNGWAYVVARSDGRIVLEQNMTPNRSYPPTRPGGCLLNGNSTACAYANTPAISPADAKIYQTYMPGDASKPAAVHAYRLTQTGLTMLWSQATLVGGTASSVAVSKNYQRLYVADNANSLVALNASNGAIVWRFDVGYAPRSSAIVNDNGYIFPGGSAQDPNYKITLLKDNGTSALLVYENANYLPISNPVAGSGDRFALVAKNRLTGDTELLVLGPNGIISSSPWGDDFPPEKLGGLVLSSDGWLYLTGVDGRTGLFAFRPYLDHTDVETGMYSETTQMISLRYMRHMWTASDGTQVAVVQQGGFEGHGLALYKSRDDGLTWEFGVDLMSDQVISDGVLLSDDSLLLVSSVFADNNPTDVNFIRLEYDPVAQDWSVDPLTPTTVFSSVPGSLASRASLAVDSNGVIWTAFRHQLGNVVQHKLHFSVDGGQNWTNSGNAFGTPNGYSDKAAKVIAAGGRIVVVHHDQRGPLMNPSRFKAWAFRDDGAPLFAPMPSADITRMLVADGDPFGSHWSLAADSAGDLHMSYQDGNLNYLKYDGALDAWLPPQSLGASSVVYNSLSVSETDDIYVFTRFESADKIYATRYLLDADEWSDWMSISREPYDGFLRMASPERFEGRLPLLFQVGESPSRLLFNNVAVEYLGTL